MEVRKDYRPISCDYYDELTWFSTQKKEVEIVYLDQNALEQRISDQITDLQTKNKEEFLITASGLSIRLDRLVSVGGKVPPLHC